MAEPGGPSGHERPLDEVVLEYLKAADAGRAPDPQEVIARHPGLADELRAFFADQERLAPWLGSEPGAAAGRPAAPEGYEILGELGRGGQCVVYKARQQNPDRVVALKMILAGAYAGSEERARLRREANAIAQLRHPNIVQVFEARDHQGQPFFSLEYVEGGTLAERLNGLPQSPGWAAEVILCLARAMQAAHEHEAGVVHRDLKPANVLLTRDGTPKVADFGFAKRLDGVTAETLPGHVPGTPLYMAPEQLAGRADARTDVHALGVILYEMLTGRPPFQGPTLADTLALIQDQPAVPPGRLQPTVPAALERVCLKCLHKQPARRYASAGELAEDLERYLQGQSPRFARPLTVREWVVDLFSQSSYVEQFAEMAWVSLWLAAVVPPVQLGVYLCLWVRAPEPLTWAVLFSWYVVLFGLLYRIDSVRLVAWVPIQRLTRVAWVGHFFGYAAVCLGYRLSVPDNDYVRAVRLSYPAVAVLTGMILMVQGSGYWSRYYLFAAPWFVLAFLAAWFPDGAPLVVGLYAGVCGLAIGLLLRREWRGARSREPPQVNGRTLAHAGPPADDGPPSLALSPPVCSKAWPPLNNPAPRN
jgi:serine/threonine-protein kinase